MISVSSGVRDAAEWDAFVAGQPGATFCHLAAWRDVMRDALGHECHYLEARFESGALAGVLPLVRVKSPLLGHYLMSMPFLNSGGPIGTTAAQLALIEAAVELASSSHADLLELRARQPVPGTLKVSSRKITVHVPLPDHPEKLWKAFPAKLRSQIRRPQKEGFEVRFGDSEIDPFYSVFSRNMRTLGTPVLPLGLFTAIARAFPGIVEFGTVYAGSEPIAAGCGFAWGGEFEITWASALREHNRSAPNMLLYWSFMQRMIERGIGVFDLGRCTPNGGTHTFKLQWGGLDVPLPWAQWSARSVDATPSPNTPMFRLAATCWSRLPLGVTNRLGPLIARRLP